MLDRLETSGYIKRMFDQVDRRKINIRLTDNAITMREQYVLVSEQMNALFYEGFSDVEIIAFESKLERILDNLSRREQQK